MHPMLDPPMNDSQNEEEVKPLGDSFLTEGDHASLFTFYNQCSDTDADGYTVAKADMRRLAELGCVRHLGFGRYEATSFGHWVIESTFLQNPKLPLRTLAEYNAEQAKKVSRG
jgi:hypothetical protein